MPLRTQFSDDQPAAKANREGIAGGDSPAIRQDKKLIAALKERHPHWLKNKFFWQKVLDLYEAENLSAYIHRHPRESQPSHGLRSKRIAYRNYIATVVNLPPSYVYSKTIARSAVSKNISQQDKVAKEQGQPADIVSIEQKYNMEWEREFLNDVDRQGTPIDRFMSFADELANLFDKVYLLLDLPRLEQTPRSEQERLDARYRPYLALYTPLDVVNFELDSDGKLLWIRFVETADIPTDPFTPRDSRVRQALTNAYGLTESKPASTANTRGTSRGGPIQYRTWTRDSWFIHVVDGDRVETHGSGTHQLGEVPVVSLYGKKGVRFPFGGQSRVKDIATLCQQILNIDSLIDEALYQQTLSILVMGRQPVEGDELVIGENQIIEISPNGVAPYYLTPSQSPVQFMETRIQVLAGEIYRLSKFSGGFGLEPKAVAPTTAAYEFNLTNRMLAEVAANCEAAELEIHRLYYKWYGRQWQGYVEYPEDFSIESIEDMLRILGIVKQVVRSPFVRREYEKKVARRLLASHDESDFMLASWEIDTIPEAVEGFNGIDWYDPLQQEKSSGSGIKVGALAEVMREDGVDPSQHAAETEGQNQVVKQGPMMEAQSQQQAAAAAQQAKQAPAQQSAKKPQPKQGDKAKR